LRTEAVCSSDAIVFSGFLIFFTFRQPMNAKMPAISSIATKTIVKAAHRGSQMASISPTMNQKKKSENAAVRPATASWPQRWPWNSDPTW